MSATQRRDAPSDEIQGEILVAARVIDFLSSGLYQSAAACLKELVNNSYDADATTVAIAVKPDADVISIEDDGIGLTREQFEEHFGHVAESHKRDNGQTTGKDRLKIGKIGIGFIAANELCDEMELYSTCAGSTDLLHVTIEFGEIRRRSFGERRRDGSDLVKGDYHGEMLTTNADSHFTNVYLKKLRAPARDQFVLPSSRNVEDNQPPSIYGLVPESVSGRLAKLQDWDELDLYSQTRMRVGLNVPVGYAPNWIPQQHSKPVRKFERRAEASGFNVQYDGTALLKPTVLNDDRGDSLIDTVKHVGQHVDVTGYMYARHGALKPPQLNGVLIRVRQAAVGEYDRNFLGYPKHLYALFQDWVSVELYVEGDLDQALNIDRRTFSETHAAYVELQSWFIARFDQFLKRVKDQLYTVPSRQRSERRAEVARSALADIMARARREIGASAAEAIEINFPRLEESTSDRQRRRYTRDLTRSFSLTEVLSIALEVAQETLSPEVAEAFIAELGRRLNEQ